MSKNRVLFVTEAGDSACTEVRAHIPAQGLRSMGWDVDVCSVLFENVDGMLYGYDGEKQTDRPRTLVVRHTRGPNGENWDSVNMYEQARKKGQRIFFDLDDNFWQLPPWNPATNWITPEVQRIVERNMDACDGILVTTPALKLEVEAHVKVPVYVMPNGVDIDAYTPRMEERKPIRLSWFGPTNWRGPDLQVAIEALYKALDGLRGKVEFWHFGYQPTKDSVTEILGPDFPVEVVEIPWVPIWDFPKILQQADVAIIPQTDNPFSDSRSNDMGLRLCAAGIPFAATMTPDYQKLWQMGAGYPVDGNDTEAWVHALYVLTDTACEEARRNIRNGGLAAARRFRPEEVCKPYAELFDA